MDKHRRDDTDTVAQHPVDTRAAGIVLALAAVVSIVFVALDPEVSAKTSRTILEALVANAPTHRLVHAVELACVAGLGFGFLSLASRLGWRRPAVIGACLTYVVGCIAMVVAAVTDGFITGDVASYYLQPGHSVDTGREMIHLCYVVVQDFATASWFFQSVGVLTMASALLQRPGLPRVVGVLGLATGALAPIAIVATYPAMDTTVVVGILLAQLVWNAAAATLLLNRGTWQARASGRQTLQMA